MKIFRCGLITIKFHKAIKLNYIYNDTNNEDRFSIVARARNEIELHTLKSTFIQTLKRELRKQKKIVYKTRFFKMLLQP